MKFLIQTMIIDDKRRYATSILRAVEKFSNLSTIAEYRPHIFCERTHYDDANKHIQTSISESRPIDLIFSDYYLSGGKNGIQLFELFGGSLARPFRVLHSNTTARFTEQSEEYIAGKFDEFSSSKKEDMILKSLNKYELTVLKAKLYGNPLFYSHYYKNQIDFSPKSNASQQVGNLRLIDVLCIETDNNSHFITYRNVTTDRIELIERKEFKGVAYQQEVFREVGEDLCFARINKQITVNLLWVSKIDLLNKEIHLIPSNSIRLIKKINAFSDKQDYKDSFYTYLGKLTNQLNRYFLI